jgi:hypothetical protein
VTYHLSRELFTQTCCTRPPRQEKCEELILRHFATEVRAGATGRQHGECKYDKARCRFMALGCVFIMMSVR